MNITQFVRSGRIIVVAALFVSLSSYAQEIEKPADHNKELNKNIPLTIEAIPELSYSNHPAVWNQGWGPHCKVPSQCVRKARKSIKKGKFIQGLGYAARTLDLAPRKRAERKALEILIPANYTKALTQFEKDLLKYPDIPQYENWKSSKALYNRMWVMGRFNLVNSKLEQIHHPKMKIKVKPFDTDRLGQLATKLSSYRKYSANDYYSGAQYYLKQGKTNNDKEAYKRAAMAFKIADEYVTGFKDAKAQYQSTKKLAISTIYISSQYIGKGKYGKMLDEDVRSTLLNATGFQRLPFVELTNNSGADYHIKMVVNGLEVIKKGKTSDTQEYNHEETDEHGKVTNKKAIITTYTSSYLARAKVNAEVIERKTGKILYSMVSHNSYHWETIWQIGSGHTDMVKSKYKRYLGKQPDQAPTPATLTERAIELCARDIARKVYRNFIQHIGAAPTHP